MPILQKTVLLPGRTPEEVFEFCLDGVNFQRIFPEPITPIGDVDPSQLRIEAGKEFMFRHWMFGLVPSTWRVRIADLQPNEYFIDEMLRGPLKRFRHEHRVASCAEGTLYTDRLDYASYGGALAEQLFVNKYMARIFAARHRNMQRLLAPL
ncbi:polyketide cyclase [Chromobacterium sphagni]|uniref:Polyketide cyclase n=1 Tax=Chromobacterium sphagni TaxID=1903179 RepID=A0A1S1X2A6_9NEIS|nr:SRPBCC family protein [Chromobacterium sphagni]OHX13488.1 polyketide cyclase [Chromobacterium sphagni]